MLQNANPELFVFSLGNQRNKKKARMESFGNCLKYFMLKINSDKDSCKMPLTLVDYAGLFG